MNYESVCVPENWTLNSDELSANVYRVVSAARDGRRIEATATESELGRVTREIIQSIHESNHRIAEKSKQAR
jgi:sigma54-dependent transcription regulator